MRPIAMSGADILRAMADTADRPSRPIPEAQVMTLREAFDAYSAPCPFKPGDIVTPRATSTYADIGVPHIVLEVLENPLRNFEPTKEISVYSNSFGQRLDMRVGVMSGGYVATYWQESYQHELYDAEKIAAIAKAQDEGFVDWTGGDRPVSEKTIVSVILRDGCRGKEQAGELRWSHEGHQHDIVKYRIEQ